MTLNHYGRVSRIGLKRSDITCDTTRFWSKVDKTSEHWLWTGSHSGGATKVGQWQYARVPGGGQTTMRLGTVHRLAWVLLGLGDLEPGVMLTRTCDVAQCMNPAHRVPTTSYQTLGKVNTKRPPVL